MDFSDRGKMSDLPLTVGGKSLKFPRSEKSTLKKSGLKLPNHGSTRRFRPCLLPFLNRLLDLVTQTQLPQLNALNHVHNVAFATFAGPDETWQMSANLALEVKRSIFETLLAGEIPSTNLLLLQEFNCLARKYERVVGSLAICLPLMKHQVHFVSIAWFLPLLYNLGNIPDTC